MSVAATGTVDTEKRSSVLSALSILKPALMPTISVGGFLLVWYLEAAVVKLIPATFLPPPTDVLAALVYMMSEPVAGTLSGAMPS